MEINVKSTSKVGILAFDLDDQYASADMEKAKNVQKLCNALSDFTNRLRGIRKYEAFDQLPGEELTDELKQQIINAQQYYHTLFFTCLNENDAKSYLD